MERNKSLSERILLADRIRGMKPTLAQVVTEEFFQRHPDWLAKYGERGRKLGLEDAAYHVDFLTGAIESGNPALFEDYARWTSGVLAARGIASDFVAENLEQLKTALRSHLADEDQEFAVVFLDAGRQACTAQPVESSEEPAQEGLALTRSLFLQAILKGQRAAATSVALEALQSGQRLEDIYVEIFQEALYETGRLWAANQISVAEEHMATAITQYVIAQVYAETKSSERQLGKMVITGVEGELHQVGANMVADMLESRGWDVRFLGTNMPKVGIHKILEEHEADVLGISTTMLFNIPTVIRLIEEVRQRFANHAPRIILGGAAFGCNAALATEMGADGFAVDIRGALDLLT